MTLPIDNMEAIFEPLEPSKPFVLLVVDDSYKKFWIHGKLAAGFWNLQYIALYFHLSFWRYSY